MTTIRAATAEDLPAVHALNAANVPQVGPLDEHRTELFLGAAEAFWVATRGDDVVGLFVGLFAGHDYLSPNYQWFTTRWDQFAYVDRIAIAPDARGTGLADAIYDRWEEVAREANQPVLCAEVNLQPPNPRSLAFHRRRGLLPVADLTPYGDAQRVAMVEKQL
jgi:uncharacterized protein